MCCQQLYRPQVRPSPPQITSLIFARNPLESSKIPPALNAGYHAFYDHGCWGVLSEGGGKSYPPSAHPATAGSVARLGLSTHRLSINKLVPFTVPFIT